MHLQSILWLLLLLTFNIINVCIGIHHQQQSSTHSNGNKNKTEPLAVINFDNGENTPMKESNASAINLNNNATSTTSSDNIHKIVYPSTDLMQSGAIERAFYVLLGGTVLLLIFLGFRMYRLRNGAPRPTVMVRKYGILTNRTDVEMLPLPLDEDDEDDTIFEVNHPIENQR